MGLSNLNMGLSNLNMGLSNLNMGRLSNLNMGLCLSLSSDERAWFSSAWQGWEGPGGRTRLARSASGRADVPLPLIRRTGLCLSLSSDERAWFSSAWQGWEGPGPARPVGERAGRCVEYVPARPVNGPAGVPVGRVSSPGPDGMNSRPAGPCRDGPDVRITGNGWVSTDGPGACTTLTCSGGLRMGARAGGRARER